MKHSGERIVSIGGRFPRHFPIFGRVLAVGVVCVALAGACGAVWVSSGHSLSCLRGLLAVAWSKLASEKPAEPRPLGDVALVSGPTPCDGEMCSTVQVSCSQLDQALTATLKIGEPSGPVIGTILCWSCWTGTGPYAMDDSCGRRQILDELRAAGFRTVQIIWERTWWQGAPYRLEGLGGLACRPATVARWIYDNIHQSPSMPFCATGHSNGASEVAYALTQYGLADIFDGVLLESGPNFSRLDCGCIEDASDPESQALFYSTEERATVNTSLGLGSDGACVEQVEFYRSCFEEASLAFDEAWQYNYPNTMVAFIFGEEDVTKTSIQGAYYYRTLVEAGSPLVSKKVVMGAGHWLGDTPQGTAAIRDTLLDICKRHETERELRSPVAAEQ